MDGLDEPTLRQLYASAGAERWQLPMPAFRDALAASVEKAFKNQDPSRRELERYLFALHLNDLALACACSVGNDAAWEYLIREYRPALYRAADALDPTGRTRELADALYADLFGMTERDGQRRSLFRYFHGRSSLATWLRSVLAQRHIDAVRAERRFDALPDDEMGPSLAEALPSDPGRERDQSLVQRALEASVAQLDSRDRLRLACYHAQQLTLAEVGRLLHEHEATVSRHLTRTRRTLRRMMETWLEQAAGLRAAEVRRCLQVALDDPGPLDLHRMLEAVGDRKIGDADRSKRDRP